VSARGRSVARLLCVAARMAVAAALLVAGAIHLIHNGAFALAVAGFHLLAGGSAAAAAAILAPLELLAGAALVSRWLRRGGALIAAMLLSLFALALAQAVIRGIDLHCGCFGALAEAGPLWAAARDLALLALLAGSTVGEAWLARASAGANLPPGDAATPAAAAGPSPAGPQADRHPSAPGPVSRLMRPLRTLDFTSSTE
jgi:putative oxidoreductase